MSQSVLKSSTAVRRFIVVQDDANVLFGLFSVTDGESLEVKAIADDREYIAQWGLQPGHAIVLDTDVYQSSERRGLTVYEVPADFAWYDESDSNIDASAVNDGELFEGYEDFAYVGAIVERETFDILVEEFDEEDRQEVEHNTFVDWEIFPKRVDFEISGGNGTGSYGCLTGSISFTSLEEGREILNDIKGSAKTVFTEARQKAINEANLHGWVDTGDVFHWNVWEIDENENQRNFVIDRDGDLIEV